MPPWPIGDSVMITEENTTIDFIRNPELLNRNTIPVLQEAIRQYPYHQSLYLLLLQNMYKVHDPQFSSALRQYALMVADRAVLFEMVEGMNYNIPVQKLEDETVVADGDRTLLLIDNFLRSIPAGPSGKADRTETPDPHNDYSTYLEQLPDYEEEAEASLAVEASEPTQTDLTSNIGGSSKTSDSGNLEEAVTPSQLQSSVTLMMSLQSVPLGATLPRLTISPRWRNPTKKREIATSTPRQWPQFI